MGLKTDIIYVLNKKEYPYSRSYYKLINPIGNYELEHTKRYPFFYWNRFGRGVVWKNDTFLAGLIPAPFAVQVLYSGSKRT